LLVKDVVNPDGTVKNQFRLPAAYTKNGDSRLAYIVEHEHEQAVLEYLNWRVKHKKRLSNEPELYLGLRPDSPLFLARGNSGFTI